MGDHKGFVLASAADEKPLVASGADSDVLIATLLHLHFDFIWRLLKRLGVAEAEDAAQQVFTVAWKRIGDITAGKEKAFLVGIALNVGADARRARQRRLEDGAELDELPAPLPDASDLLDQRRARVVLDEILATLTAELREAFVLFEVEQLKVREVAELLGIPPGTAASRLRRAREAFRAELERRQPTNKEGQ